MSIYCFLWCSSQYLIQGIWHILLDQNGTDNRVLGCEIKGQVSNFNKSRYLELEIEKVVTGIKVTTTYLLFIIVQYFSYSHWLHHYNTHKVSNTINMQMNKKRPGDMFYLKSHSQQVEGLNFHTTSASFFKTMLWSWCLSPVISEILLASLL